MSLLTNKEVINGAVFPERKYTYTPRYFARKNGEQFYISDKPCSNGHLSKRYVISKRCFQCSKEINSKRKNIDKYKITKKKYWLKTTYGLTLE